MNTGGKPTKQIHSAAEAGGWVTLRDLHVCCDFVSRQFPKQTPNSYQQNQPTHSHIHALSSSGATWPDNCLADQRDARQCLKQLLLLLTAGWNLWDLCWLAGC